MVFIKFNYKTTSYQQVLDRDINTFNNSSYKIGNIGQTKKEV